MYQLAAVALGTLLAMASSAAQARPYTLHFEGIVDDAGDYEASGSKPPANPKFSGYVTWDIDRSEQFWIHGFFAEPAVRREPGPVTVRNRHHWAAHRSQTGCPEFKALDGEYVCDVVRHRGYEAPLILDYRFSWEGGDVRPVRKDFLDESTVLQERNREESVDQYFNRPNPSDSEHWTVSRIQRTKYDSGRLSHFDRHEFTLKLTSSVHRVFFSDVTDFSTPLTPAVSDPASSQVTIDSHSSLNDCRWLCAWLGYEPNSFWIRGHLTSATLVEGPADVPAPDTTFGSLPLFLWGLPWWR